MSLAQQFRLEGHQEGQQTAIIATLEIRFGEVPTGLAEAIQAIHNETRLRQLLKAAIQADTLETFSSAL